MKCIITRFFYRIFNFGFRYTIFTVQYLLAVHSEKKKIVMYKRESKSTIGDDCQTHPP